MTSPCSVCGRTLTHDRDPRTVLCAGCERDIFEPLIIQPPPTTEGREKPTPPLMRSPYQVVPIFLEPGYRVLTMVAIVGLGFLMGWIARGGA